MRLFAGGMLLLAAASALAQVEIRSPWSRATPPGARIGVGYMDIRNHGARVDRLVEVSTPVAGRVEMHVTRREGEVMRMRQVDSFEIPARGRVELRPGGGHLMLLELARPLKKGERVPMRLRFERAGELAIELEVQDIGFTLQKGAGPATRQDRR